MFPKRYSEKFNNFFFITTVHVRNGNFSGDLNALTIVILSPEKMCYYISFHWPQHRNSSVSVSDESKELGAGSKAAEVFNLIVYLDTSKLFTMLSYLTVSTLCIQYVSFRFFHIGGMQIEKKIISIDLRCTDFVN